MKPTQPDPFPHGARWLRADFHMHTVADKESQKPPQRTSFPEEFVARLAATEVSVGVITNHNKFDRTEYKALKKAAKSDGRLLLPGVELSVQGGKHGIHLLIVFDPQTWVYNQENCDFINRLLDGAFEHVANREHENTPCRWTLSKTLEKLNEHRQEGRDSFVILAHVDDDKGAFKEMGSGLGDHFNELFVKSVLAVQKARSRDNSNNLRQWLGTDWQPAKVEGCDCKSLEEIGQAHIDAGVEKRTWIKLGAFSFAAVRLALVMKENRVASTPPAEKSAAVVSLSWTGADGLLDGQCLRLSRDLNNLIGIRGSGKSSVLECLREVLDVRLSVGAEEPGYKESLVRRTLGSGGKLVAELRNRDGKAYRVERILGESARVYRDHVLIPNLRVSSILSARYFGQKDLAKFGEKEFARELVERFTGRNSSSVSQDIPLAIVQRLAQMAQGSKRLERRETVAASLAQIAEDLEQFKRLGLEEKLKEQIALEKDVSQSARWVELAESLEQELRSLAEDYDAPLKAAAAYVPFGDGSHFTQVQVAARRLTALLKRFEEFSGEVALVGTALLDAKDALEEFLAAKKENFADVRRNLHLEGELKADTFVALSRRKQLLETEKKELDALEKRQHTLTEAMRKDLAALQQAWHGEFQGKLAEVKHLNQSSPELSIDLKFKEDRDAFVEKLKAMTTGLQRSSLEKVAGIFRDGIELYSDLESGSERLMEAGLKPDQIVKLRESLSPQLAELLTWRPPDLVRISYNGEPLQDHSLGQRATALMLFLLSQEDYDLLIVDQPEDDLDNQTLYTEVITRLLALKGKRQVVFATHSPNIPVLGDAEQVISCRYAKAKIEMTTGGIDDPTVQREIIDVMEGGEKAFDFRKQIYESWKP